MEGNGHNSDKITIRVSISDDDYQDIIIDLSQEITDVTESVFQQLAAFARIPFEKINHVTFWKPNNSGLVYPANLFASLTHPTEEVATLSSPIFNSIAPDNRNRSQTRRVSFFRDGDRFALNTVLQLTFLLDEAFVNFILVHQDIINDSECSHAFCHHSCSRFLLDKQSQIINSDIDAYLRDQPRPVPPSAYDPPQDGPPYELTREYQESMEIREKEILKDLNIAQYFYNYCSVCYHHRPRSRNHFKPRVYWPYRG